MPAGIAVIRTLVPTSRLPEHGGAGGGVVPPPLFVGALYERLLRGGNIDAAVMEGRTALDHTDGLAGDLPVHFHKSRLAHRRHLAFGSTPCGGGVVRSLPQRRHR